MNAIYEAKLRQKYKEIFPNYNADDWQPSDGEIVLMAMLLERDRCPDTA